MQLCHCNYHLEQNYLLAQVKLLRKSSFKYIMIISFHSFSLLAFWLNCYTVFKAWSSSTCFNLRYYWCVIMISFEITLVEGSSFSFFTDFILYLYFQVNMSGYHGDLAIIWSLCIIFLEPYFLKSSNVLVILLKPIRINKIDFIIYFCISFFSLC